MPISVIAASPGPLTTHPIMDSVMGVLICDNFSSKFLLCQSPEMLVLHMMDKILFLHLYFLSLSDFNISFPIFTSSTGLSDKEILIVSPIPSNK